MEIAIRRQRESWSDSLKFSLLSMSIPLGFTSLRVNVGGGNEGTWSDMDCWFKIVTMPIMESEKNTSRDCTTALLDFLRKLLHKHRGGS